MAVSNGSRIEPAFYRFKNCSRYKVNVYWSSPANLIYYNCLSPNEFIDVNTYVSHKWIFLNAENGNRLWAASSYEFCPISWKIELKLAKKSGLFSENHLLPFRKVINITYPLYTLSYLALTAVRDSNICLADVEELEIPLTLQSLLRNMILTRICIQCHNKECNCLTSLDKSVSSVLWQDN